ncbi:hypothetical protein II906_11320 [bacterium]|nr:hypothetical protein [bacterium]
MKVSPVNNYSNRSTTKGAAIGTLIAGGASAAYVGLSKSFRKEVADVITLSKQQTGTARNAYKAIGKAGVLVLGAGLLTGALIGKLAGKIAEKKQAKIAERQQAEYEAQLIKQYEEEEANKYDCPYCGA